MARVDSIQKPTTLLTLKKSKEIATDTAGDLLGEIMLITDDDGTVQGDIRVTSGKYYHTMPFVQVGSIIYYAGDQIPDGYLACDGSYISQRLYPELFEKIRNFWWNKPFQKQDRTEANEIYFMGLGNNCQSNISSFLWSTYKILIVDNEDHPLGWEKNLKGQIFQERDANFEYYYDNITYNGWPRSPEQNSGNFVPGFNNQLRFYDFNSGVTLTGPGGVDQNKSIVREPVFVLPNFTDVYTASEHFRKKLSGYFIRNLNDSRSATNPDYYKTEYDDRGFWQYQYFHNNRNSYTSSGYTEYHLTRRTFSSLQENEIKRHRHYAKEVDGTTNTLYSGISGAHGHKYHGSRNSINGDPLGTAAISQGFYDRFGRGYTQKNTWLSGIHNHIGFVGYGTDVTDESHQTFIKGDPTNNNSYETRPWSHSVQFCIKY